MAAVMRIYELPFSREAIPRRFYRVPDIGFLMTNGNAVWGWREWIAMHRRVRGHVKQNGRKQLAPLMFEMQEECIPEDLRRTAHALQVACIQRTGADAVEIFKFLSSQIPARNEPQTPYGIEVLPLLPTPVAAVKALDEAPADPEPDDNARGAAGRIVANAKKSATKAARAEMNRLADENAELLLNLGKLFDAKAKAPTDALDLLASLPISVFMPTIKRLFCSALTEAITPQRHMIEGWVKAAIEEAIGAPVQSQTRAEPLPQVDEPIKWSRTDVTGTVDVTVSIPDADKASETTSQSLEAAITTPAEPSATEPETPKEVVTVEAKSTKQVEDTPHDLALQLKNAAKALGLPADHVEDHKKKAILVVGLHHHVEQEVKKYYGHAFRFMFKNPDAFTCVGDVPASTDAILISRKRHVSNDIVAFSRRCSVPMQHVANTSSAVLWALKEHFPETAGRMQ